MAAITLRVLDGADRGKIYNDLEVPVTIGREEGNSIQLNDERISRFHVKIQQDHDDLVLTDLESTNGCKVNNEEIHLRILRHGDLITIGRSTLIVGSRAQINERLHRLGKSKNLKQSDDSRTNASDESVSINENWRDDPNYQLALSELEPPQPPERMSPGQAAKLSEMIEFIHMQVRRVISNTEITQRQNHVEMPADQWQAVLDLQSRLAEYLHEIGHPRS